MASNTVNWGPITGPHDFLPPPPSSEDPASRDASEESDPFASDSLPPRSLPRSKAPSRPAAPRLAAETLRASLDKEAQITLLRLCIRDAELWSRVSRKTFWKKIRGHLHEETGQDHTTLSRLVANLVRKRREELAGVGSGEEESSSEYNIVIDEWIKVVDDDAGALRTRKRAQGLPDANTKDSLSVRRDLTRLWSLKERRIAAPLRKKRRIDAVQDNDDDSPPSLSPFPEETPSRQETPSDISSSSRRRRALNNPPESRFEADFSRLVSVYTAKADNTEADRERKEVRSRLDGLEKGLAEILQLLRGERREEDKAERRRAESPDWDDEEDAEGEEVEEGG